MLKAEGRLVCTTPEEAGRVRAALPEHIALSRAEPGCLAFHIVATADPLVWRVSERFTDRIAFEAHQTRSTASAWGTETAGIRRDIEITE